MDLKKAFISASENIRNYLEYEKEISFEFYDTPGIGVDYSAELGDINRGFNFRISTEPTKKDPEIGKIRAILNIFYDPALTPFYFHEDITYLKGHSNFLSRWGFWAVYNFGTKHIPFDLENTFHESWIRIYGVPSRDIDEFEILYNHLKNTQEEKLIFYQFGHVNGLYRLRYYSYAFFVQLKYNPDSWFFFPDCCGLDSGGSYRDYRFIEENLAELGKSIDLERRLIYIKYDELKQFLLNHAYFFHQSYPRDKVDLLIDIERPWRVFRENDFQDFLDRLQNKKYPQALRDLRTLVQVAQETVLLEKEIDFPEDADISKLAGILIGHDLLDGRLQVWFQAFTAYANLAAHGRFPDYEEEKDRTIMRRVNTTIRLGIHLLNELNDLLMEDYEIKEGKLNILFKE